jgi:hypothetical protein
VFLGRRVNLKHAAPGHETLFVESFLQNERKNDSPLATAYRQVSQTRNTPIMGEPRSRVLRIRIRELRSPGKLGVYLWDLANPLRLA